jgi:hypothetical protein
VLSQLKATVCPTLGLVTAAVAPPVVREGVAWSAPFWQEVKIAVDVRAIAKNALYIFFVVLAADWGAVFKIFIFSVF